MKISELIELLNYYKVRFGDLELHVETYEYDMPFTNDNIGYDSNRKTINFYAWL